MSDAKKRFVTILIPLTGAKVIDPGDASTLRVGTVHRRDLDGLWSGDVHGAGSVSPLYAAELGLEPDSTFTFAVTAPGKVQMENGARLLEEVQTVIAERDDGRLRKLCSWFPCVLRLREVHECLDALPRATAEQIVGLRARRGPRPDPAEERGLVATMDRLHAKGLSISKAASLLKRVCRRNITAERLKNLHSDLRELVGCLRDGYWIAAADASRPPWGQNGDQRLPVYVQTLE